MSTSSGSLLSLSHIFGLKGDVKDPLYYLDESHVLYPAGYNVVVYNLEKKTQRFLPLGGPPPVGAAAAAAAAQAAAQAAQAAGAQQQAGVGGAVVGSQTHPSDLSSASSGDISALAVCNVLAPSGAGSKASAALNDGSGPASSSRVRSKILAVAERGDGGGNGSTGSGRASISVFDLVSFKRRGKSPLICPDMISTEFVCMSFSPDGKVLMAQGGAPDWTLITWSWEKGKILQMAKVSNQSGAVIHQVSFCPSDPSVVCVTGNGILRFLHIEQNEFKSIPFSMGKREPQNYLAHCWIEDRILVGTDSGDILVFENAEFRGVLESSPSGGKSIDVMLATSKGFLIGMDEGYLMTYERNEKEIYKYAKSFQIDGNFVKVKSLAISPSEEAVVATLENNQAYILGLTHSDLLKSGSSSGGSGSSSEDTHFEPLHVPFHHMSITGLDVCIRKPLVATCGLDRSVRIWNYLTRSVEVLRFFNEQPHSLAFHPSGLHLLVGFSDNLRLINILMDDLVPFRDFAIKSCKEVRFSHGGQYFAAANGSVIQVFATYTCEMLGSFNVHKAKVRSITWLADDSAIVSAGMDGCVFTTKIKSGEHVANAKHKCNYTSAVATPDGKVYAAGSDRHLKVMQESTLLAELNCGVVLTQLATQVPRAGPSLASSKDRFLFAGTDTGVVRVFPLPVEGKCYDQQVHVGGITRMRASPDEHFLFTVGEDGCFAIFTIEARRDVGGAGAGGLGSSSASSSLMASRANRLGLSGGVGGGGGGEHNLAWAEEILVNRSDLEEKLSILSDLQAKVTELMLHNETTLALKDMAYKEKLRDTSERFNAELEANRRRYESLESEKVALETAYKNKVDQLNALQKSKVQDLTAHHEFKLAQEAERYAELEQRIKAQREAWEAELAAQEDSFTRARSALTDSYEAKISDARQLKIQLMMSREAVRGDMMDMTTALEADADAELDEIKQAYDKKLTVERMTTLWLKDENAIFKRKFASLREDIADNLDDLGRMREKQQALYDSIDTLEKDIKGHIKEIKERDSTIADKRQRIFELQKKNQELEKFKFVLDYKITELKRQIQPRKQEMKELSQQIAEMDKELKQYKKESADLQLDVTELHLKSAGMDANISKEIALRDEVRVRLQHFKSELHEVFQDIEDNKKLKDGIKRLFQKHVQQPLMAAQRAQRGAERGGRGKDVGSEDAASSSTSSSLLPPPSLLTSGSGGVDDLHSDYHRQRHYLERSLDSHNAKMKKDLRVHVKEHTRIMAENIALTKEVNELRREKYHILVQQKSKEQMKKGAPGSGLAGSMSQRAAARMNRSIGGMGGSASNSAAALDSMAATLGAQAAASSPTGSSTLDETEVQQEQIRALKKQLALLEREYAELAGGHVTSSTMEEEEEELAAAAKTMVSPSAAAPTSPLSPHPPPQPSPPRSGSASGRGGHSARSMAGEKLPSLHYNAGSGAPSAAASYRSQAGGEGGGEISRPHSQRSTAGDAAAADSRLSSRMERLRLQAQKDLAEEEKRENQM